MEGRAPRDRRQLSRARSGRRRSYTLHLPALNFARHFVVPEIGKLLVILGVVLVGVGLLMWSGLGGWMVKLPGDIRIERNHGGFYFPIVTCIVISIVLSLIFSLFRR
jgi:Protein of unknown function (DUF2905)